MESLTLIFLPRLVSPVRVLHPHVAPASLPHAGGLLRKTSVHDIHHSLTASVPVWFTVGFAMSMADPESLVPQIRGPGCHVGHTE